MTVPVLRQSLGAGGPLSALTSRNQFILWFARPKADGVGVDKVPCDSAGVPINAQNPASWMSAEAALATAELMGLGVGWVITEGCGIACLDLDKCLTDGVPSEHAQMMLRYFPGAAVETSYSGNGWHLWMSYHPGALPAHASKTEHGEFYSGQRFIALSGHPGTYGDAGSDHTATLATFLPYFFPPLAAKAGAEWTDLGVDPDEDGALLSHILRNDAKPSPTQAFGGVTNRATFSDLWNANVPALAMAFPHDTKPYDASSADASLAQRLAFWTNKDCARIERMMRASALKRDKWDRRGDDYLERTIVQAVGRQVEGYSPKPPAEAPATVVASESPIPSPVDGSPIATAQDQIKLFEGCVYIETMDMIFTGSALLDKARFDQKFGHLRFVLENDNSKIEKSAWETFKHSTIWKFPKVRDACFRPRIKSGAVIVEAGVSMVNTYCPPTIEAVPGDVSKFAGHLEKMFPVKSDRDIFVAYLAAMVQFPGFKFQWAPLVQGAQGNGKTMILEVMERSIGRQYCHRPNARDLDNKFTAWIERKLLIGIDEIKMPGSRAEMLEVMKPLITNGTIEIQGKGADQRTGENVANFLMFSNHKDAIIKQEDDRRYAIFYTGQQSKDDLIRDGMTKPYFTDIWDWLDGKEAYQGRAPGWLHVNHWLRNYSIPAELNPARECNRAPMTSSTQEALSLSLGNYEQAIQEAIENAEPGFRGGFVSSVKVAELMQRMSKSSMGAHKVNEMMKALGYVKHPSLPDGRSPAILNPDGKKPRLYVKPGHPSIGLAQAEIGKMYSNAQVEPIPGISTS
jgi:hypothetical protein